MTGDVDCKKLAVDYVRASNAHDVEAIGKLLSPDAIYQSSNVGDFSGVDRILTMMARFFAKFPDVNWQAPIYVQATPTRIKFDFIMTATNAVTGEKILRQGLEYIDVGDDGLIVKIEVI